MNKGLLHKIAVLGKDYYSIRTIDDLFIFSGADPYYWIEPKSQHESQRICHVYGWIEGIEKNAPDLLQKIVEKIALQMINNENIPDSDKQFLRDNITLEGTEEVIKCYCHEACE